MKITNHYGFALFFFFIIICLNIVYGEKYIGLDGPATQAMSGSRVNIGAENIVHWANSTVSWKLNSNGAGDGLTFNQTKSAVQNAFNSWQNVLTADINFSYGNSTTSTWSADGNNVHYWAESGDPIFNYIYSTTLAVTVITINSSEEFTDVDIVFNGRDYTWRVDGNDIDIEAVSVHEIGHMIGLHHTEVTSSPLPTMYAIYQGISQRTLEWDDEVGVSFLYKGNLIDNETLSNKNYLNWSWTIASGKTLTIQSGAELLSKTNVSLTANGTISAVGTSSNRITFNRNGTSGNWGGIIFNAGAAMTINYCNIYNADYGIKCNNPVNGPNVQNCNISSCNYGIYATNYYGGTIANNTISSNQTGIYLYNIPPNIYSNSISSNSSYGIYCDYYSNPYVYGNTISSSGTGIFCRINSSPHFSTPSNGHGNNIIQSNNTGLHAEYSSNAFLGSSSSGGYNIFEYTTNRHVEATYSSGITAQYNWWGSYPPDAGKFYTSSGGWIDYSNALQSRPMFKSSVLAKSSSEDPNISYSDDLEKALDLELVGNYMQALTIYKEIFEQEMNTDIGKYCMVKISDCYFALNRNDTDEYFASFLSNKYDNTDLEALRIEIQNKALVRDGKYDLVLSNLAELNSNENFNEVIRKNNLYNTALLYLNCYYDYLKAKEVFFEFKKKYPDDRLNNDAELLLLATSWNGDNNIEKSISETLNYISILLGNYPNPFNPTTSIQYQIAGNLNLPEKETFVSLKVYDILGREVTTLVNEMKKPGTYSVTFDASELASGMYIYKLQANDFVSSKKMLLVK